ncbi:Cytochrome c heme lyase subunit CcmF [Patulibacter medicamentivorans]|uniref:Cytochrome c heme lyase subunit CcmF n=1 Tax=Patulibacter medicamentivorans TaxID=1097667 RepID=H0E873_9ACTN|nr:cytochrome c-type biogenesis CcmF C-terminal domain-containing protein [Patulibacter medicamentivorans]EHN10138.1 Cytochrome c heme lyase subunit CcmF [Patulibacter medicamentivorans]
MALLGRGLLALALAIAVYGVVASIAGARAGGTRGEAWTTSGRRAVYLVAALATVSFLLLEVAFIRTDLRFEVVADHSSSTTPLLYRIAAPWSSQEGSLLLWVWLLSLWSSLVLWRTGRRMADVVPWAQAVLLGLAAFFLLLLTAFTSPFSTLAQVPFEGVGLSPLLQYPSMMIHPPMLYSGYTLFAIPFAFAVGALAAGHVGADWIRSTRRYALGAWLLLGIGLVLGARWSYAELGWGGYWGWDAVENAGLMPFVLGTAFLHSVMIQEKRGMLRTWNASLILGVGVLCILGTFIVRSGVLSSIHAFGSSTLGIPFLILLATMIGGSIALVTWRRDLLRSEHRIDSLLSREAFFLAGNVVLVGLVLVILWGTFFPLIGEALTGQQRPLETVWWGRFVGPLALVLTLLMGFGPLAAWRRTTAAHAWRQLRGPLAVALLALAIGLALGAGGHLEVAIAVLLGGFVLGAVGQELQRGVRVRRTATGEPLPVALGRQVGRNRRRYGGYLVHAGIAVLIIAVAASSAFKDQHRVHANVGDRFRSGGYELRYEKAIGTWKTQADGSGEKIQKIILGAQVGIYRDGKRLQTMRPTREYFPSTDVSLGPVSRFFLGESATEVALDPGIRRDLWLAMQPDGDALAELLRAVDDRLKKNPAPFAASADAAVRIADFYRQRPSPVTFQVIVSPLVTWIWIGALLAGLGGLLAIWPAPDLQTRRVRARHAARVARDLGRAPAGD